MASFSEAFKAARKRLGAGKTFEWNGKKYTTDYASEKSDSKTTRPKARPKPTRPKARPEPARPRARPAPKATPEDLAVTPITKTVLPPRSTTATTVDHKERMRRGAAAAEASTKARKAAIAEERAKPRRPLWRLGWPFNPIKMDKM
jgi:hypothetical protein